MPSVVAGCRDGLMASRMDKEEREWEEKERKEIGRKEKQ
jgi:hypothetical protein